VDDGLVVGTKKKKMEGGKEGRKEGREEGREEGKRRKISAGEK
jgi:hypothetical protein